MAIVQKALLYSGQMQASCIISTDIVNDAIKTHNLTPVCAAALGRTLTVTALLGVELKNQSDKMSITIKGNGPIGDIITACDSSLNLRGYVFNPDIELPLNSLGKLDVKGAVGTSGTITVIKDLGLKMPYVGQSPIVSGEIAEDFAAYLSYSEQQPGAVALGVLVDRDYSCKSACGIIVKAMPGCTDEVITRVEKIMTTLNNISTKAEGLSAKQFIEKYFAEASPVFTDTKNAQYKCSCSKQSIDGVIVAIGKQEAESIIAEKGKIDIKCHFCNKDYIYYPKDIMIIFKGDDIE